MRSHLSDGDGLWRSDQQADVRRPLAANDGFVNFIDVEKTYDGEMRAVRALNLDIREGEFLTLLGPSGSGKTTTLMMLAGFEAPTGGDILLRGESITNVPPFRRNFGMVFQNYALFPHMTVLENVAYPLRMRRIGKFDSRTKARKALDAVRLQGFEDRRPSQLSGGQQQRVALARALVFEPTLILMDEPLGALDKSLREHMQLEIKHLHERLGNTIVYVTHDQSESLTMSDRIAVFKAGMLQQIAPPTDIYEHPKNSFVAQFIGENNTLHGTIESTNKNECSVILDTGERVIATKGNVSAVGARTTLSLRPERLELNPTTLIYANRFRANVLECIYLGDHNRYRVNLADNDTFIIRVANKDDKHRLQIGDEVEVCWSQQHCIALDPMTLG